MTTQRRNVMRRLPQTVLIAAIFTLPLAVHAQPAALPSGADVIARYIKATHIDLLERHNSIRSTGKIELPAAGISGTVVELRAMESTVVSTMTLVGRGESRSGFDGEHGWSIDPANGPRLISGDELNERRTSANFRAPLRDSTLYRTRETLEVAEYAGQKCYKLRMVTQTGRESLECYSVDTGLLVASVRKVNSPMGSVDNVSLYSDYKEFGGMLLASKTVSESLGQRRVITVEGVVFDEVKPAELELPPQVKALIRP
jgi:hypothetical protein